MTTSNYIYPSAKIRALEPKILDQTDIERMVDAPDFSSAFKVLNDTDYADNLLEVEPAEFRKALTNDFKQLYGLLEKITPDKRLFQLLFLERDLVNLKLLFKAKHFEQNVDGLVEEDTVYPLAHFKEYIFEQKDIGLNKDLKDLIAEAQKQITEDTRPDQIDAILTKEYFKLIQNIAGKLGNAFIKELVKIKINNANIITFLRAKKLNLAKDRVAEKLIKGGTIDLDKLMNIYADEIKGLRPIIAIHYSKELAEIFDNADKDLLAEMEVGLANYETRFVQKARLIAAGPEVIAAYYLAKEKAVANIQIILTGKYNKIPAEDIKKYLVKS